jgi:hypothetical protein
MAYYSTFIFQLPGCPEIRMSTRYDVIQAFGCIRNWFGGGVIPTKPYYKPSRRMETKSGDNRTCSVVALTKHQRRKIQTFLNVVYRKGNHKVPRRWRKFVKNDGVFPHDAFDQMG